MSAVRILDWGGPTAPIENARHSWTERRGLLLVLEDASLGEATPLPEFGDDNLTRAREALETAAIGALLELRHPNDLAAELQRVASPSARFALETALLDRLARTREQPLADLLAGCRVTESVPLAELGGMLGMDQPHPRTGAIKFKARGRDLVLEERALADLRSRLGSEIEIRLDLNGSLDLDPARRALEMYGRYDVRFVEEPVSGRRLLELGQTAVSWLADESLRDGSLADELVNCEACAGVVLKPTLLGGLTRCLALGKLAKSRDKLALVSHTFEGPVALAAAAELALALSPEEACGLDRHTALDAFARCEIPVLTSTRIEPVHRQGIGIAWNDLP